MSWCRYPALRGLTIRITGDGEAKDIEDIARAIVAVPKLLRAANDALNTPPGAELFRWKKRQLEAAVRAAGYAGERKCLICGCTEGDCRACIERLGSACHWVREDLCSACAQEGRKVPEVFRDEAVIEDWGYRRRTGFLMAKPSAPMRSRWG